jgi:hypothetical protein
MAALSLAAASALAASTTSSVSLEGSSASVGSLSGSIETSSNSSSQTVVAAGPYRVIEVAALPPGDGAVRVRLQALDGGREFALRLPPAAAGQARLAAGDIVDVRERAYGLQFARADVREPFFLLLDDAAWRELQSRPVTL